MTPMPPMVPPPTNNNTEARRSAGLKRFGGGEEIPKAKGPSKLFTDYYVALYLFLVAAFAASAILVHRPLIQQIKQTNAETQNQIEIAGQERDFLKTVQGSVAAVQSIPSDVLDQVENALPENQDMPSLLVQLGAAAAANGVAIDSIAFNPNKSNEAGQVPATGLVMPMDINLAVRAPDYFAMKRFLASLESSLRLMDMQTISLSGEDGKTTAFTIQLRTYTYQPPGARQPTATAQTVQAAPNPIAGQAVAP